MKPTALSPAYSTNRLAGLTNTSGGNGISAEAKHDKKQNKEAKSVIFSSHKMRNVFILLVVLVLSGCDKVEEISQYYESVLKPYEKKPNVNVRFSRTDPTEKYYKGSVVWIDYPLGKLKIPADYYQSGSISPDYAVADLYVFWPAMVGYIAGSKGQFDIKSIRLFTTFEKEKGTRFTHEDYYLTLQQRIKNDRVAYVRASPQYSGLTEYWSTALPNNKRANEKKPILAYLLFN